MQDGTSSRTNHTMEMASLSVPQMIALVQSRDAAIQALQQQVGAMKHQLDWFRRQLFGHKSARFAPLPLAA